MNNQTASSMTRLPQKWSQETAISETRLIIRLKDKLPHLDDWPLLGRPIPLGMESFACKVFWFQNSAVQMKTESTKRIRAKIPDLNSIKLLARLQ